MRLAPNHRRGIKLLATRTEETVGMVIYFLLIAGAALGGLAFGQGVTAIINHVAGLAITAGFIGGFSLLFLVAALLIGLQEIRDQG